MSAATILSSNIKHTNKRVQQKIVAKFSTTDATCTVPVNAALPFVVPVGLVAIGTPASDEILSVSEASHTVQGVIVVASGVVTIARTGASKTSALIFALTLESP